MNGDNHANQKRLGCFLFAVGGRVNGVDFVRVRYDDSFGWDKRRVESDFIPRAAKDETARIIGKGRKLDRIV